MSLIDPLKEKRELVLDDVKTLRAKLCEQKREGAPTEVLEKCLVQKETELRRLDEEIDLVTELVATYGKKLWDNDGAGFAQQAVLDWYKNATGVYDPKGGVIRGFGNAIAKTDPEERDPKERLAIEDFFAKRGREVVQRIINGDATFFRGIADMLAERRIVTVGKGGNPSTRTGSIFPDDKRTQLILWRVGQVRAELKSAEVKFSVARMQKFLHSQGHSAGIKEVRETMVRLEIPLNPAKGRKAKNAPDY